MAKNPNVTDFDQYQMARHVFDQEHDAIRVKFAAEHEMAIALSAEDNDSVETVPRMVVVQSGEVDCSRFKRAGVYGNDVTLQVSPTESGDDCWITVANLVSEAPPRAYVTEICAKRARIVGEGYLVLQS